MAGLLKVCYFTIFWALLAALTYGVGLILLIPYWYIVISGSQARMVIARAKLDSALMKNEKIISCGLQLRIYALWSRRELVAITSSRLVLITRSIFGGFSMKDYQWKDLSDAIFSENIIPNIFGANLRFLRDVGGGISIEGLASDNASLIYSHAQAQEQEWEEKNRIRSLEEKRAMSGSPVVQVGTTGFGGQGSGDVSGLFENLEKAAKLFESGAISDAEYQELKSKILSKAV